MPPGYMGLQSIMDRWHWSYIDPSLDSRILIHSKTSPLFVFPTQVHLYFFLFVDTCSFVIWESEIETWGAQELLVDS